MQYPGVFKLLSHSACEAESMGIDATGFRASLDLDLSYLHGHIGHNGNIRCKTIDYYLPSFKLIGTKV